MGVLGGKGPLSNILSEESVEPEPLDPNAVPDKPPPIRGLKPGAAAGIEAPPSVGGRLAPAAPPMPIARPAAPSDPAAALALLKDFYTRKAAQMQLPTKKRFQPRPEDYVIDTDYATPAPERSQKKLSDVYPRHDKGAVMPKNDRTRPLIEFADQIAERYAQYIRQSGVLESDTRLFYHVDGPIYRAAIKAGLSHEEAMQWLDEFSQFVAATSPKTKTVPNILNASSAMAKTAQGVPHRQILGPGTTAMSGEGAGIGEAGYPMFTGEGAGGLHGKLIDRVIAGEGISHDENTKPSIFGPNMSGNRSGVTVDMHVIKGLLMTLNDLYPGRVPQEWFASPEALQAYTANPSVLTANMIHESLASAMVGAKGATLKKQVEYPVFADIIHKVAKKLKIPDENVADAQAMGWFGMGERTGLGSPPKTAVDILNERISVTAQMMGKPPQEVARMLFRREIPLASLFGLAVGAGAMQGQSQGDDITDTVTGAPPPQMTPERFQQLIDYMRRTQPVQPANNPVATLGIRG